MGSRMLKHWLLTPRRDRAQAAGRLAAIAHLREGAQQTLRARLKGCSDVERITARIALRQVRPRELVALQMTLHKVEALAPTDIGVSALLASLFDDLQPPEGCAALLRSTVMEEPAALNP